MRRRNWRVVSAGVLLIILAVAFFFIMSANAGMSTDPQQLMKLSGNISGILIGLSMALIALGLIGKKA
jgi:hypothetical protein